MKTISITVPKECEVRGEIVESTELDDLSEDMIEVAIPGGILIECGWVHDSNQKGSYVIEITMGLMAIGQLKANSASDAARLLQVLTSQIYKTRQIPSRAPGIERKKELVLV